MNIAVLGAQWGDEGKGKIVDLLTPHFSVVGRYQGGHNAGHTVYVARPEVRPAPDSVGHPASRRHLPHRQRRGRRSGGAVRRSRRAEGPRHRRRGPAVHQRPGAPHPAVPPRARRAQRGAARRAQDRHHLARHRPGLRGQDRPPRRAAVRPHRRAGAGRARSSTTSTPATRSSRTRTSTGARSTTRCSAQGERLRPWTTDVLAVPAPGDGRRAARAVRGRAGHDARHRSRHLSRSSPRRTPRLAACAPGWACRRRRSAACSAWPRPTPPASAKVRCRPSCSARWGTAARERQGVRRLDRPAAPLRLVRRRRRALRGAAERPAGDRAHQARRARRPRARSRWRSPIASAAAWSTSSRRRCRPARRASRSTRRWPGWSAPTKGVTRFDDAARRRPQLRRAAGRGERRADRAGLDRIGSGGDDHPGRSPARAPG